MRETKITNISYTLWNYEFFYVVCHSKGLTADFGNTLRNLYRSYIIALQKCGVANFRDSIVTSLILNLRGYHNVAYLRWNLRGPCVVAERIIRNMVIPHSHSRVRQYTESHTVIIEFLGESPSAQRQKGYCQYVLPYPHTSQLFQSLISIYGTKIGIF